MFLSSKLLESTLSDQISSNEPDNLTKNGRTEKNERVVMKACNNKSVLININTDKLPYLSKLNWKFKYNNIFRN